MKLVLTLEAAEGLFVVPLAYNEYIQAALYRILPADFAEFLHDSGYEYERRRFRFFSFSRILGKYDVLHAQGLIRFVGPVRLVVTSPLPAFSEAVLNVLIREGCLRIGSKELNLVKVESYRQEVKASTILVRTLSPITVYSTLYRGDGRKYTVYFHPRESSFTELVRENLRKKYRVARDELGLDIDVPEEEFVFEIRPKGRVKKSVVTYKNTFIQGYSGVFELSGPPPILQLALDASLGSKNSQGFGCVELLREIPPQGGGRRADREPYSVG